MVIQTDACPAFLHHLATAGRSIQPKRTKRWVKMLLVGVVPDAVVEKVSATDLSDNDFYYGSRWVGCCSCLEWLLVQ